MRQLMTIIAFVIGTYLLICAAAFVFQSRLTFFPERQLQATPAAIGLEYEDTFITTSDGITIHGWFVPGDGRATLIFFHGNAGNISHRLDSIRLFHSLGLAVLIIDYRGYGRSEGRISETGSYRDADAAYRYLVNERGVDPGSIVIFGRSLGSAVAIELAARVRSAALIAESCFTSMPDVAARHYRLLPVKLLMRIHYDCVPRVAAIDCPKLFAHSRTDEVIPYDLARKLYAAASAPKEFLELQGDHNAGFLVTGRAYAERMNAFLNSAGLLEKHPPGL